MTKEVSHRDICFVKAVILWCEHRQFSLNFTSQSLPPYEKRYGESFVDACLQGDDTAVHPGVDGSWQYTRQYQAPAHNNSFPHFWGAIKTKDGAETIFLAYL